MFSRDIVQSDAFLDMPVSTQALYFQLGMEADDDGFIGNPKKVIRVLGCSDDDLKILLTKRFVILFESGVLVVKHHRINNNYDKHNSKRTVYLEEFNKLFIKENKAYTLDGMQGIPAQSDYRLKPVFRLEEKRIEEKDAIRVEVESQPNKKVTPQMQQVFDLFQGNPARLVWKTRVHEREAAKVLFDSYGIEELQKRYKATRKHKDDPMCPQVDSPADFLEKMPKMERFLKTV